jgi:hypothetical protein
VGKFNNFVHFCTVILPASGVPAACPLPACAAIVLAYLGWLQDEDRVHHGSLQPYLTSINQAHQDAGFDKPAAGKLVALARKGFGELEAERRGTTDQRVGLPAAAALEILDLGLTTTDPKIARAATAVVISYSFFARGDTGAHAAAGRLVVDDGGIHFSEDAKNLARIAPATLTAPWPADVSVHGRCPHALLRRFLALRDAEWLAVGKPTPAALWQMPGDAAPPMASAVGEWLASLLTILHITAPPGVKYTGHSLRGGAASAALAAGVSLPAICRWGLWRALDSIMLYLDPLVADTPAAQIFFAHLVRRSAATM